MSFTSSAQHALDKIADTVKNRIAYCICSKEHADYDVSESIHYIINTVSVLELRRG